METNAPLRLLVFSQKRLEVSMLYDLYCKYIRYKIAIEETYAIPDSFLLTTAFSLVFPELKLSSGYVSFIVDINFENKMIALKRLPHHWLTWEDENHIIDVLPVDGMFGVSVPQAVLQNYGNKRFFLTKNLFPKEWSAKQKVDFENKAEELSVILQGIMSKSMQY